MKKEQPDKLFHEKLADFEKAAPTNAWDRIEAGLDGNKKLAVPYWRVAAAAILVIGLVSYLVLNRTNEAPAPIAEAINENPIDHSNTSKPEVPAVTDSGVVTDRVSGMSETAVSEKDGKKEDTKPASGKPKLNRTQPRPNPNTGNSIASREPDESAAPETVDTPKAVEEIVAESTDRLLTENHTQVASANRPPASNERESITLIMTADDTKAYLKKNSEDGATPGSRKTSTLKRVLQKASELKSSDQDPIGDLRQMKNEILALNFKSEKHREQKQVNQ